MASIIWFDPNNLIFVTEVQRSRCVRFHREMKRCDASLQEVEQVLVMHSVIRCDEICTTEA